MFYEENKFMNGLKLSFFSSVRVHSCIMNGLWLKYLIKKIYEFECLHIEKNGFFFAMSQKE